jgi:hypothetical protein
MRYTALGSWPGTLQRRKRPAPICLQPKPFCAARRETPHPGQSAAPLRPPLEDRRLRSSFAKRLCSTSLPFQGSMRPSECLQPMTEVCSELGAHAQRTQPFRGQKLGARRPRVPPYCGGKTTPCSARKATSTTSPGSSSKSSSATRRSRPFSPFLMMAICGLPPLPRTSCDLTSAVY